MIGLLQRVDEASVTVGEELVGAIGAGLLVLVGVQKDDDERNIRQLLERVIDYSVFPDEAGRMNLNLRHINEGPLLVTQFPLAADSRKTMRASFTPPAPPEE